MLSEPNSEKFKNVQMFKNLSTDGELSVVDGVPLDMGCKVLDGELTHDELDENDSEHFTDGDDAHILLKWGGGHNRMLREVKCSKK